MELDVVREDRSFKIYSHGEIVGEITYAETRNPKVVEANHTFVSEKLRGQGVAGKLLDTMVESLSEEGKLIKAKCSYVVSKFDREPEKYDFINVDKQ